MGTLNTCIGELEGIKNDYDAQTSNYEEKEEEKNIDFNVTFASKSSQALKESTDIMKNETMNDKAVSDVIISMEEGNRANQWRLS